MRGRAKKARTVAPFADHGTPERAQHGELVTRAEPIESADTERIERADTGVIK